MRSARFGEAAKAPVGAQADRETRGVPVIIGSSIRAAAFSLIVLAASHARIGFLKTDGIHIRDNDGKGDTVWLYGVNYGGLYVHEPWMSPLSGVNSEFASRNTLASRFGAANAWKMLGTYWDSWAGAKDFELMAREGMNVVRMPVFYLDFMDDQGNWRKKADGSIDFDRLDRHVADAKANGVYTIIDLHGAPGGQNGADHSGRTGEKLLYSQTRYQDMMVKFWEGVAEHYKDEGAVAGYDLMNEPSPTFPGEMGNETVEIYDRCYKAIRQLDTNHVIYLEATWTWPRLPNPTVRGWKNVAYSLHYYKWQNNGDFNVMKQALDGWLANAKTYMAQYKVPHLAGEFTLFGNPQSWEYGLRRMVEDNWHWTVWNWKVTGSNSSWGVYTAKDAGPNTPNVSTMTQEEITARWGRWNTEAYFTRNPMVADAIKKATALRKVIRPTPTSVTPRPGAIPIRRAAGSWILDMPESRNWKLTVRTAQGRTVSTAHPDGSRPTLVLTGLDAGIYSVTAEGGGKILRTRLIHSGN